MVVIDQTREDGLLSLVSKRVARLASAAILFFAAIAGAGQEALNNDAVVKMVKSGLSEGLIITMIQNQPGAFTLNPDELSRLKNNGVSEKVLEAMINKGGPSNLGGSRPTGATPSAGASTANPNDPLSPHDSGIYLYSRDRNGDYKLTVLEQAAYQGSKTGMLGLVLTSGLKKAKTRAVIVGQHASIRTPDTQPTFYFYFEDKAAGLGKGGFGAGAVSNPNQFALVKLEVTKATRETVVATVGAFGGGVGTDPKAMVMFKSEKIREGLYKVTPTAPMEAGEYCFLVSQVNMGAFGAGAAGAAQIFDFGVTPGQ